MRRRASVSAICVLTACGGTAPRPATAPPSAPATTASVEPAPARPAPSPAPGTERTLAADQPLTTASGSTLSAPAGWTVRERADALTLIEPAREATVTFVEVSGALDRDAAARAAWAKVDPTFAAPVAQAQDVPASDGWEQLAQLVYVTPTEESRAVVAVLRRYRGTWYVALVQGTLAALDRRGAQLGTAIESFRVPGMEQESFAGKPAVMDAARLAQLAEFIEAARQEAGVPGVAVAVVKHDQVLLAKGFGVRELGDPAPVTPDTRFMIGSTTKALTTLMMARLVDAKKLTWDTPVTQLWPSFALGDKDTTAKVTLQHTVCACTGMPRRDLEFIFEYAGVSPETRIASMRDMQPTTGFGETFQYSNLMVAAGGYLASLAVAPTRGGKTPRFDDAYAAAMRAQVLGPLGMKSTSLFTEQALRGEHAMPHARGLAPSYEVIPLTFEGAVEAVRPAGAAWSTVRDLAQYAQLELGEGMLGGRRLVSRESMQRRRTPQIKISDEASYGLGLMIEKDHGAALLHHGGNTIGFTSDVFVLPEHDLGVVLLTNAGGANALRSAVRRRFLELAFGGKPEAQRDLVAAGARMRKRLEEARALIKNPPDTAWMSRLVGTYHNEDLGKLEVRQQGAGYLVDAGEWSCAATQEIDLDKTPKLVLTGAPYGGFELVPRVEGGKTVLVLDAGQVKYVFSPTTK